MNLETYKDNGGRYHWQLVATDGTALAASIATFASREDAHGAAEEVHEAVATTTIEAS